MSNSNLSKRLSRLKLVIEALGFEYEATLDLFNKDQISIEVAFPDDEKGLINLRPPSLARAGTATWSIKDAGGYPIAGEDYQVHAWLETFKPKTNVVPFPRK